ncbi:MAG: hypothetical protein LBJ17_08260, partial [Dysgonamonadaceae bacterium]|nr:hypothetical protein [Dysgonamonadaceae bacterium]
MTAKCLPLFVVLCFAAMFSCNTDNRRIVAEKIIREWTGKQIVFKEDVSCSISGNDTMCLADLLAKEYKILLYVDSAGCSSCRLKLSDWKQLIEESDSLFQDKLGFVFLFQPKSKKELSILVNVNEFDYPIVVDMTNSIDKKNHFPAAMEHQCFLLNRENEVIAIGNPAANIKIWKLYKKI